jgi:hypothetical protein
LPALAVVAALGLPGLAGAEPTVLPGVAPGAAAFGFFLTATGAGGAAASSASSLLQPVTSTSISTLAITTILERLIFNSSKINSIALTLLIYAEFYVVYKPLR